MGVLVSVLQRNRTSRGGVYVCVDKREKGGERALSF